MVLRVSAAHIVAGFTSRAALVSSKKHGVWGEVASGTSVAEEGDGPSIGPRNTGAHAMRHRLFVTRFRLVLALAAAPLAAIAQIAPAPPGVPSPIQPVPGPPGMNPPHTPPHPPVAPPVMMPDAGAPPAHFGHDAGGIRSGAHSRP